MDSEHDEPFGAHGFAASSPTHHRPMTERTHSHPHQQQRQMAGTSHRRATSSATLSTPSAGPSVESNDPHLVRTRSLNAGPGASLPRRRRVGSTAGFLTDRYRSSNHASGSSLPGSPQNPIVLDDVDESYERPRLPLASTLAARPSALTPTRASSYTLPVWQPDEDVAQCPVCGRAFGLFNRKHHCRRCGKVVCAACSPHRITVPRQYIVRNTAHADFQRAPAGRELVSEPTATENPSGPGALPLNLGGGEVVRVCNPCVPDPNPNPFPPPPTPRETPPSARSAALDTFESWRHGQGEPSLTLREALDPRLGADGHRSYSPLGPTHPIAAGYGARYGDGRNAGSYHQPAWMVHHPSTTPPTAAAPTQRSNSQSISARRAHARILAERFEQQQYQGGLRGSNEQLAEARPWIMDGQTFRQRRSTHSGLPPTQHGRSDREPAPTVIEQALPRPIAEEDECPICARELPARGADGDETDRERHIEACIRRTSGQFSSTPTQAPIASVLGDDGEIQGAGVTPVAAHPPNAPNPAADASRARMLTYKATEKDCASGDGVPQECDICLEEIEVGVEMARLECLCRFHKHCIRDWWSRKGPGSCPTHQIQI